MTPYSKYEIYTTVQSIYCYKGSGVLKTGFIFVSRNSYYMLNVSLFPQNR